jgi:hypothetical protein
MDQYISALYQIVREGNKTNSYKFALWRALARLAPHTVEQRPKISKQDLAAVFLEYYWPLEVKYHIRQQSDPDKDPVVMVRIRDLLKAGKIAEGETLRDFCKRTPSEYERLLGRVAREAFNDVIPRLHIVRGVPIKPAIFTFSGEVGKVGDTIELTGGGRRFLIDYAKVVDYVAVSGWVHFTEGFTSAPRLHDKIDGGDLKRGAVTQWRGALLAMQNSKCFYCESHDIAFPEVDHVLPWTFVLEDRTWNLVLACRKCNNGKRDRLVDSTTLERLCARNEQISGGQINLDPRFFRHFEEWHSRDLSSHVRGLYDQAIADGFPNWNQQATSA